MNAADFYFVGGLDDFLPLKKRGEVVHLVFEEHQSFKHLIESLGVPYVELGEVTANGKPVSLGYRPRNGDRVEVRPAPPGCPTEPRFILDNHLGRLAAYLRMLGFDCLYENDYEDAQLAESVTAEDRILLTRDRRLLMRKVVRYGYCPRSLEAEEQLREVVRRFDLAGRILPFHRCLRCNGPLEPVSKEAVLDRLEPLTRKYYDEFRLCSNCDQVYWKGSHFKRMETLLTELIHSLGNHAEGE